MINDVEDGLRGIDVPGRGGAKVRVQDVPAVVGGLEIADPLEGEPSEAPIGAAQLRPN